MLFRVRYFFLASSSGRQSDDLSSWILTERIDKSLKYGGWGWIATLCFARNWVTLKDMWTRALSWCKIQFYVSFEQMGAIWFLKFYSKIRVNCLSGWHKLFVHYSLDVKEGKEHGLQFCFAHSSFLMKRRLGRMSFCTLPFCFRIILKSACFTTGNHSFKKIRVTRYALEHLMRNWLPLFLLFASQNIWNMFKTQFFCFWSSSWLFGA